MPSSVAIARAVAGWSPVIRTGVMPASLAGGDGGGGRCPGRVEDGDQAEQRRSCSQRSASSGSVGRGRPGRRRGPGSPSRASSSARVSGAGEQVGGRRRAVAGRSSASGAPLQTIRTPPSGSAVGGGHAFAVAVEGHLAVPWAGSRCSAVRSRPSLAAAVSSAASVGSPTGASPALSIVGWAQRRRRCTAPPPAAARPGRARRRR